MSFTLLKKDAYVFVTEICREAVVAEDGTFSPGREIPKGAVLQSIDTFPNYRGINKDLVRCRVVRSPSLIAGAGDTACSDFRVTKNEIIVLYMREVFPILKSDATFQEEVKSYEESDKIQVAKDMGHAMRLFLD